MASQSSDDIMETEEKHSTEPSSLGVRQFVAARVTEITSLTAQIGTVGGAQGRGKGFSFQHVSKHMRRRAVSHNPKRLPSRLRASHLAQLRKSSGGLVKKPKRPRRKYRKRSDADILEYNRRQLVNPKWLESHIWHAKRFHMKSLWDRKLAIAPTAKCFRSLFRAARQTVIMQDISYLAVLEISGPVAYLAEQMSRLIPNDFSIIPQWNRELLAHIVSPATSAYIGSIKYLWVQSGFLTHAKILVWVHPALKFCVIEEMQKCFELVEQKISLEFPEFPTKDERKHLWKIVGNQCWSNQQTLVSLKDLNGCFNRIRLVGPKTLAVLKEILKVGRSTLGVLEDSAVMHQQDEIWKGIQKLVNVPDNTVIPLNVIDPRRELPDKRRRVKQSAVNNVSSVLYNSQILPQDSPLWREDMRRVILRNKTSDEELSRSRSENLIPGTTISDGKEPDVVPIALVTRSHISSLPGMDLILPCGWLMPFWIALSYRCVRSYALEFNDYLTLEEDPYLLKAGTSSRFPPDSVVYCHETEKTDKEARTKYFSYPPAKRQNLIKLGCAFPFSTNWHSFLKFLSLNFNQELSVNVRVLRKREDLQILASCLRDFNSNHAIFNDSTFLTPINVVLLSGAVEKGACICLPTQEDLNHLSKRSSDIHILQQPFKDTNESKRTELSSQHHKKLSRLRKKRKIARRSALGSNKNFDLNSRLQELDSKLHVEKYNQEMNNLWLSDNVHELLSKQDREIMGFTEYAHFSFVRGKSAASGYVALGQLKRLLQIYNMSDNFMKGKRTLRVLVRNWASSLTYHWAKLEYPRDM